MEWTILILTLVTTFLGNTNFDIFSPKIKWRHSHGSQLHIMHVENLVRVCVITRVTRWLESTCGQVRVISQVTRVKSSHLGEISSQVKSSQVKNCATRVDWNPSQWLDLLQHWYTCRSKKYSCTHEKLTGWYSSQSLLQLPRQIPSKSYGQWSFFYAAPSLWNNLSQQIRTADNVNIFKSLLKTHLFNAVYSWLYLI